MKIYTRIVMDSMTGKIEDADFCDYQGPIAELKDSPSPPPAPDYTGAAQATAAGNTLAAQQAQQANLVNQNTPYGSINYTQDPTSRFSSGNPSYSSNINLSPTGQQLLSLGDQSSIGLGKLQGGAMQNVANTMSHPFSMGGVQQTADASYKAQTARLDPQWAQNTEMNDAKLANQGITPGSQAYDNQMRTFNQAKNDAYSQATQNAIANEPQTYQLASAAYNQPLNELNALRTGSQVTNPTFSPSPQQQTTQGPNYLGATQATGQYNTDIYNQKIAQNNATTNGILGLGGNAAMVHFMSDRRLKRNIRRIGTHKLGIGLYDYMIAGKYQIGVMADEVESLMPHAVMTGEDGYKRVNYGAINA